MNRKNPGEAARDFYLEEIKRRGNYRRSIPVQDQVVETKQTKSNPLESLLTEESVREDILRAPELWQDEGRILQKMGARTYFVMISYDITDPKRLSRMAKHCLGYGHRVQKSMYECHLNLRQLQQLYSGIDALIEPDEGDLVRIYRIAGTPDVKTWGHIPPPEEEDLIFG